MYTEPPITTRRPVRQFRRMPMAGSSDKESVLPHVNPSLLSRQPQPQMASHLAHLGYRQSGSSDVVVDIPFFEASLCFALVVYLFEAYLDLRQYRRIRGRGGVVPTEIRTLVDEIDAQKKAQPTKTDTDGDETEEPMMTKFESAAVKAKVNKRGVETLPTVD